MKIELNWVSGPWPGRLAIMPRPRGGDWLEDEVRAWRRSGVDVVVSLLTPDEIADFTLADEEELCRANGIQFLSFPITDRSVPSSRAATAKLLTKFVELLAQGKGIAIHCRQGIGRAGLIAACLLVSSGIDPETAIQRVTAARGCPVPETPDQRRWITEFARTLPTPSTK
jgi:protein-tyrosine phosphatase